MKGTIDYAASSLAMQRALQLRFPRAELQGRSEPLFADIEAALREEHASYRRRQRSAVNRPRMKRAMALQTYCNLPATGMSASSASLFPIDRRKSDRRSAAPNPAILAD